MTASEGRTPESIAQRIMDTARGILMSEGHVQGVAFFFQSDLATGGIMPLAHPNWRELMEAMLKAHPSIMHYALVNETWLRDPETLEKNGEAIVVTFVSRDGKSIMLMERIERDESGKVTDTRAESHQDGASFAGRFVELFGPATRH